MATRSSDLIKQIEALPPDAKGLIADFVAVLSQRYGSTANVTRKRLRQRDAIVGSFSSDKNMSMEDEKILAEIFDAKGRPKVRR